MWSYQYFLFIQITSNAHMQLNNGMCFLFTGLLTWRVSFPYIMYWLVFTCVVRNYTLRMLLSHNWVNFTTGLITPNVILSWWFVVVVYFFGGGGLDPFFFYYGRRLTSTAECNYWHPPAHRRGVVTKPGGSCRHGEGQPCTLSSGKLSVGSPSWLTAWASRT